MKFSDIERFPNIYYHVDIPIEYIPSTIERYKNEYNLNMNPDFQRDYVWIKEQKVKYVEYLLKEPTSGLEIYFNHPNWMGSFQGEMVLIDGKQRLSAVLDFLDNKIKAYGFYCKEFEGNIPFINLSFNIGKLKTRKEILKWYLDFNTGGTYHTEEEINKVKKLIVEEGSIK
jgi:hypothetical protein